MQSSEQAKNGVSQKRSRRSKPGSSCSEGGSEEKLLARNAIIDEYSHYVKEIARALIRNMHLSAETFDELVSAGYLGLIEAAERYEEGQGVEFRRFAYLRIKGSIIDGVRKTSDLSSTAYRYAKSLRALQDLEEDDASLIREEKLPSSQRLARVLTYAAKGALAYRLSHAAAQEEIEGVLDEDPNPEEHYLHGEHRHVLNQYIDQLPEREQIVLRGIYFEDLTLDEISERNGNMTRSWVSRIHGQALNRMKKIMIEKKSAVAEEEI